MMTPPPPPPPPPLIKFMLCTLLYTYVHNVKLSVHDDMTRQDDDKRKRTY